MFVPLIRPQSKGRMCASCSSFVLRTSSFVLYVRVGLSVALKCTSYLVLRTLRARGIARGTVLHLRPSYFVLRTLRARWVERGPQMYLVPRTSYFVLYARVGLRVALKFTFVLRTSYFVL